jgi:hypothetical protein
VSEEEVYGDVRATPTEITEAEVAIGQMLTQYSEEFDEACASRHAAGAEKYGPGKFMSVDTLQEAIDEVVDLANYARYTFIKLRLLQDSLAELLAATPASSGFIKTSDLTKVRGDKEK